VLAAASVDDDTLVLDLAAGDLSLVGVALDEIDAGNFLV
jgi:hypothetical protein